MSCSDRHARKVGSRNSNRSSRGGKEKGLATIYISISLLDYFRYHSPCYTAKWMGLQHRSHGCIFPYTSTSTLQMMLPLIYIPSIKLRIIPVTGRMCHQKSSFSPLLHPYPSLILPYSESMYMREPKSCATRQRLVILKIGDPRFVCVTTIYDNF